MPVKNPTLFLRRGRVWTIIFPGPDGKPRQLATKFIGPEQEHLARKALRLFIERRERGARVAGESEEDGPMTVVRFARKWLESRQEKDISIVRHYRARLNLYILPDIGWMRVDAVKTEHIAEVMRKVEKLDRAPRTKRHVYDCMHAMFAKAVPAYIEISPCNINPEDLPRRKDANPEWRPTALFSKDEVVLLLTDPRLKPDRRVFYALLFLTGMRFGEGSALRVRHYVPSMSPLAQLQVAFSYDSWVRQAVKETKTETPRLVPVHPWLKQILDEWLAIRWALFLGRSPGRDDILVPSPEGGHRRGNRGWAELQEDLEMLGLRRRRQHDSRHTFITHAISDGAIKSVLKEVTHGKGGDIMDLYNRTPWASLCAEVAKLKIGPPTGGVAGVADGQGGPQGSGNGDDGRSRDPLLLRGETGPGSGWLSAPWQPEQVRVPLLAPPNLPKPQPQSDGGNRVATLALRQALAAIDRGRVDQAREILQRAIDAEASDQEAVS